MGFLEYTQNDTYPIDGYERTGIRRLARLQMIKNGTIKGTILPGADWPLDSIKLNLTDKRGKEIDSFPVPDPDLQIQIEGLFHGLDKNYSISVLDITKDHPVRIALHRENASYQPGSVGKLIVLTAFFTELKKLYPNNFEKRIALLKSKVIHAGNWALSDHHTVPVFDPETQNYSKRKIAASDDFTLFEWLDHMISVSNNGAASVVWREAMLMQAFGKDYPDLTFEQSEEYFKSRSKTELSEIAIEMINQPLRDLGITEDEWRLGKFFTSGAGTYIPGRGGSTGTTIGLMKWMIKMEQGKIVDEESSLEMKRLLYMTDRRIRYAYAPVLREAAVYFKSGSFYSCTKNEDGTSSGCKEYQGTKYNYMNSVAIVEHPDGTRYLVCLMSNVLGKNSANDHYVLASRIDKILRPDR
ncbi:hypothetical protein DMZ48_02040 [Robertkochia solimangrovi]|nr:hypothetical protein DMZ48_02040 [Robertkochia solimangrovi]